MQISKEDLVGLSGVDLARFWAGLGVRVLPVAPAPAKRPLIGAWQDKATDDRQVIEAWWRQYPEARVGILTGDPGFDVLDFDVAGGKPGIAQLDKLMELAIIAPGTFWMVVTPSGGRHLYFKGSAQRNKQNEKAIPGVDFRGAGGMVLAAGNPGYEMKSTPLEGLAPVEWESVRSALVPTTPLEAPRTNQTALPGMQAPRTPSVSPVGYRSPKLVAPASRFDDPVGEESPLDWVSRTHDIEDMLRSAGWKFITETGGRRHYRRPGKEEDVSGNVATMPDGRRVFYNFSSSVGMPTDRALSGGQLYAWLFHGGNMGAAASDIRRTLMPSRYPVSPPVNRQPPAGPSTPAASQSAGVALVPASQAGPPDPVRQFWSRRPELREIWWQSQLAGVSPWAVLGGCLAQIAARVGPHVQLPPPGGMGAPGSLNLLIAISGNSGTGKGLALGVARGFFGSPNPPQRKPGTGQGIAAIFTEQTREGPVQTNDTATLNVSEITGLGAHADMQGSNLVATLLEIYMGEELGEHYANKEKRRPVREGAYRLALTAGVQPGNSHIILDHAESGLPQRFIWMPAFWPDAVLPETSLLPPAPGPELRAWRSWSRLLPGSMDDSILATGWSASDAGGGLQSPKKKDDDEAVPVKDVVLVTLAPAVRREVDRDRQRRLNVLRRRQQDGEDEPGDPDSHLLFARLKVAAHLAFWLDCTTEISEDMWDLSQWVIWVSTDTRIRAAARLNEKAKEKNSARAMAQVAVSRIMDKEADAKLTAAHAKVSYRIETVLADGEWHPTKEITVGIAGRDRKALRDGGETIQDVLAMLLQLGRVQAETVPGGTRYRIAK